VFDFSHPYLTRSRRALQSCRSQPRFLAEAAMAVEASSYKAAPKAFISRAAQGPSIARAPAWTMQISTVSRCSESCVDRTQ